MIYINGFNEFEIEYVTRGLAMIHVYYIRNCKENSGDRSKTTWPSCFLWFDTPNKFCMYMIYCIDHWLIRSSPIQIVRVKLNVHKKPISEDIF